MKLFLRAFIICVLASAVCVGDVTSKLLRSGLPAKVSVRVRDQDGNVVPGAEIIMAFAYANREKSNVVRTKTDENGIATDEELLNDRISIHVEKDGYYKTFFRYSPWEHGRDSYKTGRWEPWNPMIDVVLYEKKNPRASRSRSKTIHNLLPDTTYGFDLVANQVVYPDEKEKTADFFFRASGDGTLNEYGGTDVWKQEWNFSFNSEEDGFISREKNKESGLKYTYLAPEAGYVSPLKYTAEKTPEKRTSTFPKQSGVYQIFRVTRKNAETGEDEHYYGIITYLAFSGFPIDGKFFLSIDYHINHEPGDRNIEYNE